MKEVTVVIPNYNGMKYLPECMASLCQGQENAPEYEVLIIDNGWNIWTANGVAKKRHRQKRGENRRCV